jgi:hypothetical protein
MDTTSALIIAIMYLIAAKGFTLPQAFEDVCIANGIDEHSPEGLDLLEDAINAIK